MNEQLSAKNIIISIIKSIDLYNFLLKDHHRRTAIIAYQLGSLYGMEKKELDALALAASLHDIGALHITERDKLIEVDVECPERHEQLGAAMLSGFAPFAGIASILRHHHVNYGDFIGGKYDKEEIPLACFLLNLSDRIDVLLLRNANEANPREKVVEEIAARFGTIFHPCFKEIFDVAVKSDGFWLNIEHQSFGELLFSTVDDTYHDLTHDDIKALVIIFAQIVDYKSPWTSSHSQTVGILANKIGQLMGLSNEECLELTIAGYLHDIGKVAVPTELINKPGPLDQAEMLSMKEHAIYSNLILSSIHGLEKIARWASNHHEKRDRSGYPKMIDSSQFDYRMDIIAYSDIISALTEDRPYRKSFDQAKVRDILLEMGPAKLDRQVLDVIVSNMDDIFSIAQNMKDWTGSNVCLLSADWN